MLSLERSTLVGLLSARALLNPDNRLYTFLADGEEEGGSFTAAQLDRAARRVGAVLQRKFPRGARALLLYPPGLDFIVGYFGAMYGGLVAVPAYPPNPVRLQQTLPRFRAIVRDSEPSVILTTELLQGMMESIIDQEAPELRKLAWVCTDAIPEDEADRWTDPQLNSTDPAFLQYTSGSTGDPKGVIISHRNVMQNGHMQGWAFRYWSDRPSAVSWLPWYHDLGLMYALQALFNNMDFVFMSPLDFLQRPVRWLQAITKYRAEISVAPNFAYELCLRKVDEQKRAKLDLSSWHLLLNGAEPLRATTLRRFQEYFAPAGLPSNVFYACYGLAESTVAVACSHRPPRGPIPTLTLDAEALKQRRRVDVPPETPGSIEIVACGEILAYRVAIVDPDTCQELPPQSIGEVWVQSPNTSSGYWRRPEATEATFGARLANGDGPFLRTGDLGCIEAHQLYILGRLKELIIVHGRNLFPHDVEEVVEKSSPLVRPGTCAAFGIQVEGEERLAVAFEVERRLLGDDPVERKPVLAALVNTVRQVVSEHFNVRVHEVALLNQGGMLKTSSGKLRRKACSEGMRDGTLDVIG